MTLKETIYAQCFALHLQTKRLLEGVTHRMADGSTAVCWTGEFTREDGSFDSVHAVRVAIVVATHGPGHPSALDQMADLPLCTLFIARIPKVGSPSAG